jgi:transposase
MRTLKVDDAEVMILALQDEIHRSEHARYDHRLHAVLMVAQGLSARQTATYLGDSPRTVEYWVNRFNAEGPAGLVETPKAGRPSRLSREQLDEAAQVLRDSPRRHGIDANLWDGKTFSHWIARQWGVELGVRQCQRLFRTFGFRLRKPRPMLAHADPEEQRRHKRNS